MYNADSKESVEEAIKERKRFLTDVNLMAKTQEGKAFLKWIVREGGLMRNSFTGDIGSTAFNEGRRNFALKIFSLVGEACQDTPELFISLLKEDTHG